MFDGAITILSSTCKNIEILNLKQCVKLTDKSFVQIGANLNKIISLNLESCNIGDEGLDAISQGCPNIEAIELSWCQKLTSKSLTNFLKVVANLKHFSAKGLDIVNDAVVKELSTNCKNLLSVNLKNCKSITDEGVISIANNCPQLRHLCISHCKLLTDASLIALGQKTNDLYVLESSRCSNFTDAGFIALSKGCPNLVRLDLEECSRITDLTLQHLASNCVNLRHLTLSRCECITDEGIRQLGSSHSAAVNETLQIIELDNCPLITDVALEQLYSCHSLMQLELYDCQLITRNGIKKFQNKLPNVKVHAYFAPSVPNNNQRPSRSCSCKCCTIL